MPVTAEITDINVRPMRKPTGAMRVLVTGHHGYIGSVLAPMLRDAGHDVVGLDTFFYRGCDLGFERRARAARSRSTSAT